MNDNGYHIEFTGDQWESSYGHEASEVRLWSADGTLVIAAEYCETRSGKRGTYELTRSDLRVPGMTDEFRTGWRTWQRGLEAFADAISSGSPNKRDAVRAAIRNS